MPGSSRRWSPSLNGETWESFRGIQQQGPEGWWAQTSFYPCRFCQTFSHEAVQWVDDFQLKFALNFSRMPWNSFFVARWPSISIYINIVPSRATKGWSDRSPWDIRWLHSQETGDQGQLLILVDCFSPGKHGVAGKACRVLQDHRCSLSTGRQRAWPSFVNKINITRHKVLGVPQQEKYCNTETQLKDPYSFGC